MPMDKTFDWISRYNRGEIKNSLSKAFEANIYHFYDPITKKRRPEPTTNDDTMPTYVVRAFKDEESFKNGDKGKKTFVFDERNEKPSYDFFNNNAKPCFKTNNP